MLITNHKSITFFHTEAAAIDMANRNGGEAEGFFVTPAIGREGCFIIKIYDEDDILLGNL